ncbi:MAG: phage tail protein [Liquorilactobacillus nagelii]|jgi:phage minor structural protein|uniref:phage tail spike protein n=1 Tax=Liquorilactobacillus nagelii TaxID=82688 RepID=UPI00242BB8CB|nr:phage tail spike protein [Liquorilactobacillus nagelii]MCI1921976.1 phage tail protein [Liquorilactobacillus nagelii]MCI1976376.1 phage tail protein [Liquorilactobacillus nagelii]
MNYQVVLFKNESDSVGALIHASMPQLPKMQSTQTATLTQSLNAVDTFEFSLGYDNPGYNLVTPMRSLIKIFQDGNLIFFGRVIKQKPVMDTSGLMYQTFDANSVEDFLHDSVQIQQKISNCDLKTYLRAIISQHNSQVEDYKKFSVGTVTVTDSAGSADRYLDYEDTFDAITNRLINVYGGYITVDYSAMTINYLSSIGSKSSTPLRIGFNMKSANKTIDSTSVITRLIPTGADSSTNSSSTDTSSLTTDKQPTTAKTTLANQGYVDNQALIDEFGIVVGTQNFDGVTDATTLQQKAKNWLGSQSAAKESWEISVSNLYLIDKTIDDFKVGNQYQFINDFVAPTEWLQVSELDLDLVTPTSSTIKIGSTNLSLSAYLQNKVKQTQSLQKKISLLSSLTANQAATISKQADAISKISDNYSSLSDTVQNIINNNDVWISGQKFIDTSSNNGAMNVSDFTTLYNAGVKGIMVKATQGTTYVNPLAASHLANANSAGIKTVGAYHFLTGDSTGTAQGQAFLAEIQALGLSKTAIVACDIEDKSLSSSVATLNSMISDFYAVLTAAGYTNTCDYAPASWFGTRFTSTAKFKWIASIGTSTKPSGADAWQYTWTYNGGKLDCSYSYNKAFV